MAAQKVANKSRLVKKLLDYLI